VSKIPNKISCEKTHHIWYLRFELVVGVILNVGKLEMVGLLLVVGAEDIVGLLLEVGCVEVEG